MEQSLNKGKLENNGFILSRSPDKAMQEMMEAIDALRAVYTEENDALINADTSRFLALQDKKLSMARQYQAGTEQLLARKEEFKDIAPELRQQLQRRHEEFTAVSATNLEALGRMRKSVGRLGERIMKSAREAVQKDTPNYSASGSLNRNDRPVSLGLNESA